MTAIWGPMGWMTLHSAADCFPDSPTTTESILMQTWVTMFGDTITCPHCRVHFGEAVQSYSRIFPQWTTSRAEFMLATFRIHNAVNRRLVKPIHETVEACFAQLRQNTANRTAKSYRDAYLNHIRRFWRSSQDASGFAAVKKINELQKIENEYLAPRDTGFTKPIPESIVVLSTGALDNPASLPDMRVRPQINSAFVRPIGIQGGRFRLR